MIYIILLVYVQAEKYLSCFWIIYTYQYILFLNVPVKYYNNNQVGWSNLRIGLHYKLIYNLWLTLTKLMILQLPEHIETGNCTDISEITQVWTLSINDIICVYIIK